jgi:hypothetical protein
LFLLFRNFRREFVDSQFDKHYGRL